MKLNELLDLLDCKEEKNENNPETELIIEGADFSEKITLENIHLSRMVLFRACNFPHDLHVNKSIINQLNFEKCKFRDITFVSVECESNILFQDYISRKISLHDVSGKNCTIALNGYSKEYSLISIRCKVIYTGFHISNDNEYEHKLVEKIIVSGSFENTKVQLHQRGSTYNGHPVKSRIEELLINANDIDFDLSDGYVGDLTLCGNFDKGRIYIRNIEISKLKINDFYSKSTVDLTLVTMVGEESTMSLVHSDLGNAEFNHCDFTGTNDFYYYSSNLDQVKSRQTRWPRELRVQENRLAREIKSNETQLIKLITECDKSVVESQKTAYFRQIKTLSFSENNKKMASDFASLELNSMLSGNEISWPDRFLLSISKVSSSHGTNWVMPLLWLLFIASIFSLLFSSSVCGSVVFVPKDILMLVNPAHRITDLSVVNALNKDNLSFLSHAIDTLSRVGSSYFIYQAIRASRRYL